MPRRTSPLATPAIFALFLALLPSFAIHAVDGALDPSFWTDGKLVLSGTGSYEVAEVLTAPGGFVVVVGTHDPGSGIGTGTGEEWFWRSVGTSTTQPICTFLPPGGASRGRALTARFDGAGRLVVAGSARYGTDRLAVARFSYPDCTLDDNFDGDGYYTLDLPGGSEEIMAMDISGAGVLTFGGYRHGALDNDMVVLQLTDSGAPVGSFSGDGWLTLDVSGAQLDDGVQGIVVDAQNRVVVGGSTHYGTSGDNSDFIAARFTTAGALDSTFAGDGIARVAFDLGGGSLVYDEVFAMALDPATGAIVLAGFAKTASTTDLAVARLTATGEPDTTFSTDGKVNQNFGFAVLRATAILLDGLGRVTVAGRAEPFSGVEGQEFIAARFLANGSVDNSFSGNGWTTVGFDLGPGDFVDDDARAAVFDGGRLVLAGGVVINSDFDRLYALTRFENALIFADGLERGSTRSWSASSGAGP